MRKVKRTYSPSETAIATGRELVSDRGVASTQDALVEMAIAELARRVREAREAEQWARASADPAFRVETAEIEAAYRAAEVESWPA